MDSTIELALLKNVIDSAPLPIAVYTGKELKISIANNSIIKIWGKGSQVIGKFYTEILPELGRQNIFEKAINVFKTGQPYYATNERVEIIVDGVIKIHYFNYSFIPLFDKEGKIFGIINTGADVTDLNSAKIAKQEAEYRLTLALDSSDLGTYETDLITNSVSTSIRFNKIWDIEPPVKRIDLINRIHPDDKAIRQKAHDQSLINGGDLSYEVRILHRNQSIHWIRIRGKVIFNAQNVPIYLLGIVQDITEQTLLAKELEQQVQAKTEELERSNTDLAQFAHVVSHDLKEPIRKIEFFNNILKSNPNKTVQENVTYINKIELAAKRMSLLIEGVLNYSTVNASQYAIEEINLNTTIENITNDLELVIQEKNAILVKDEFPNIQGVPILIHQLFYNLINNALKFSKATEPPRVIISAKLFTTDKTDFIAISVKDNGIGISAVYSEKIFDAFQRLHSKDKFEGNGLGLSLCKKIVERHKGFIKVVGEENIGSEFIVTLPLKQMVSSI